MKKFQKIEMFIKEKDGIGRIGEPVTAGIPFPKGFLLSGESLMLIDDFDRPVPVQKETLARWPDGSVKWMLLDFMVDCKPYHDLKYFLVSSGSGEHQFTEHEISIEKNDNCILVDTGAAVFEINTRRFLPFQRVFVNSREIIESSDSATVLEDDSKNRYWPDIDSTEIEAVGPVKCVIRLSGRFRSKTGKFFCNFIARLFFYRNKSVVRLDFTIRNPRAARHPGGLWDLGDPGSIYFRDLSLSFALSEKQDGSLLWTSGPLDIPAKLSGKRLEIYQDSSGGDQWNSPAHVNRFGKITSSFRGYRVFSENRVKIAEGDRIVPVVNISGACSSISAIIRQFWQNFPKSIEVDEHILKLGFFPGQFKDVYELQGGEQKTHTSLVCFDTSIHDVNNLYWAEFPLVPRMSPEWYSESMALGYLSPSVGNKHRAYEKLVSGAISGEKSFFKIREESDEYGWRHFGDVYANHERVGYNGDSSVFVSHYNNQYDIINGCIFQFARTGDIRWYRIMDDLVRHVIDIDIYHTKGDRPAFNGGMFWHTDHFMHAETSTHRAYSRKNIVHSGVKPYGGGLSPEHCYTTGLCNYYYLTGDVMARDAVIEVAEWIMNQDKIEKSILGIIRKVKKFYNSLTDKYYMSPDRAHGNALNALVDAYTLLQERKYLVKAEEIIRKCIAPDDDIDELDRQKIELRWFYLIFLQSLGRYLDLKRDFGEYDEMFNYAKESLIHHARWMLEHESPYKDQFNRMEIPSSTWAAHDVRKSAVFDYAAMFSEDHLRMAFMERAEYFFERAVDDVLAFDDGSSAFVRPIAILMNYGETHLFFHHKYCSSNKKNGEDANCLR
jgi:hypothetical protein